MQQVLRCHSVEVDQDYGPGDPTGKQEPPHGGVPDGLIRQLFAEIFRKKWLVLYFPHVGQPG
jgi:hypothetical protein